MAVVALCVLETPHKVHAQCATSTCIELTMIGLGQNVAADFSDSEPRQMIITGADSAGTHDCANSPIVQSGLSVYRWYAPDKQGQYINYDDAFCLSQGCSYQGALTGSSECRVNP